MPTLVTSLRTVGLVAVCVLAAAVCSTAARAAAGDPLLAPQRLCPDPAVSAPVPVQLRAMFCYHDYARRKVREPALRRVSTLERSASLKARWVTACRQFTHVPCGHSFPSAFREVGYTRGAWRIGENLGWGAGERGRVRTMFASWLASPRHREDIVRPDWREIGLARLHAIALFGARDVTLWVTHFGVR